ncbi:hypothetical protein N7462_003467 [Penicillium macrosclerotiorum]|uniref:uncharacterized protein n=1 Tax=Penicillium macrosclerotiorum TaxID=303699 RepID=UPI002548B848|nr:uncharacterized protein N7462_003467 [Penicillium macrosclerotiorum]KAJ5689075.1 hypothetical protein N7462_003467 [Penicillium macrosclerotiorum]
MADYTSWKVTDLKAELKKRGIPQTGLRLKQQFIDKLTEEDAKSQSDGAPPEAAAPEKELSHETAVEPVPQVTESPSESQQPVESETKVSEKQELSQPEVASKGSSEEVQDRKDTVDSAKENVPGESEELKAETNASLEESTETTAEPAEKTPGDAEPAAVEISQSADIAVPSALQTSEANTELSTPLPIEEALEDKRKRKRRSQSPVPTPEAIANKRARAKEENAKDMVKDDQPVIHEETQMETAREEQETPGAQMAEASAPVPAKQDARFRGLFAVEPAPPIASSSTQDVVMEDADVTPALHAATAALYINGLMRPFQPTALRNHLINLAAAPGEPSNPEVIQEFYLDAIKTHCFVRFGDTAAAARVRSALHGTVWPNESNRKSLWADFIPDEQIQEWISTEEAARNRPGPPVRWEVRYESTEDGTTAILEESGPGSRSAPSRPRESGFTRTPPLGPRGSVAQAEHRPSNAPPAPPSRPGQGFKPLDDLFKSTTTKPKLYYLPVPRAVADKRLDQFDDLLNKGPFPRRGGDEMRRITFEDEDFFVDVGPEYGPRALQRRQGRGGRPGGPHRR